MDLHVLWFSIVTVLFIGYFFLEGFDFGVGILLPFIGKNEADRKLMISAIGPFWDANEVWLIFSGAAIFAAFPNWYATMFSGFYLALLLVLLTLIVRGVGFEFRNRSNSRRWRNFWDAMIFLGSLVPGFIWGVALTNILKGVAIDQKMHYVGSFFDLLNPYALLGGATFVALFTLHGAIFLSIKTEGRIMERAQKVARRVWLLAAVMVVAFAAVSYLVAKVFEKSEINPLAAIIGAGVALVALGACLKVGRFGFAFAANGLVILLATLSIFLGLYPHVMVSSLNPDYSLTIYNASASQYSLGLLSWIALGLVPVVIAYQSWNYWVFRKRVSHHLSHDHL